MKQINYVEYQHSYAHALEPKIKTIYYNAVIAQKPVTYIKAIIKNALRDNPVLWTEKEKQFFETAMEQEDAVQLYKYCSHAINKARETFLVVDDAGKAIKQEVR